MATASADAVRAMPMLRHWPEYAMEAAGLGIFMISACVFGTLFEHPASPVRQAIADPFMRRILMGCAMGSTAIALIYSRWGMRSGAHFNPAVTLTFASLGKIAPRDVAAYIVAQLVGGALGVMLAGAALGRLLADERVHYVATLPGSHGVAVAWVAEFAISFLLISVVLRVSNHPRWAQYTGVCAGILVALYIIFEAPLSGMSMNPARTVASALGAGDWTAVWIYLTAPPLGMLAAAAIYTRLRGHTAVFCAKLHHQNSERCIFCDTRRVTTGSMAGPVGDAGR